MHDILLQLDSYPDPTPLEAVDRAINFATAVGATLSAVAVQVDIRNPSNRLADHFVGLSGLVAGEEQKSRANCETALTAFSAKANAAGVLGEARQVRADLYAVAQTVAALARTRDLCIVPVARPLDGQRAVAEAVIFGSGRPSLVFRSGGPGLAAGPLGLALVAWDGSRAAARALADALTFLPSAREVRVLTVVNEKREARSGLGAEVVRHLKMHGVTSVADDVDAAGRRIGPVLEAYAEQHRAELLVMGAFGHSRVREFILGGATQHMLHELPLPIFISH